MTRRALLAAPFHHHGSINAPALRVPIPEPRTSTGRAAQPKNAPRSQEAEESSSDNHRDHSSRRHSSLSSSSHRRPRTFADVEGSTGGVGDSNAGGDGSDDDGSGDAIGAQVLLNVSPVVLAVAEHHLRLMNGIWIENLSTILRLVPPPPPKGSAPSSSPSLSPSSSDGDDRSGDSTVAKAASTEVGVSVTALALVLLTERPVPWAGAGVSFRPPPPAASSHRSGAASSGRSAVARSLSSDSLHSMASTTSDGSGRSGQSRSSGGDGGSGSGSGSSNAPQRSGAHLDSVPESRYNEVVELSLKRIALEANLSASRSNKSNSSRPLPPRQRSQRQWSRRP